MYNVPEDSVGFWLSVADGIIISGGPDINPAIYGREYEKDRCENIDYRRDTLEMRMIRYAIDHDIPLLCICRGQQMLNAFMGGSLIIDIPTDYDTLVVHRQKGKPRAVHMVSVVKGTMLSDIVKSDSGLVNSSHHQAVELLAPGFRATAYAPDSIIEAIEPSDSSEHPFILSVQWHPEAMYSEPDPAFSLTIARRFMAAVYAHQN
jgi:putative glutamine amidotransferase